MSTPREEVRQRLCELIVRFGTSVCEEVLRCEGLLRDLCPGHRAEVNLLVTALRERVVSELGKPASSGVPVEFLLGRLGKRLEEEHGLTADAARWAVESWALALGRITAKDQSAPVESAHAPHAVQPVAATAEEKPHERRKTVQRESASLAEANASGRRARREEPAPGAGRRRGVRVVLALLLAAGGAAGWWVFDESPRREAEHQRQLQMAKEKAEVEEKLLEAEEEKLRLAKEEAEAEEKQRQMVAAAEAQKMRLAKERAEAEEKQRQMAAAAEAAQAAEAARKAAEANGPASATKENPFENSLGMRFVPVPIGNGPSAGRTILFSIWETRVKDYAAYAAENPGIDNGWKRAAEEGWIYTVRMQRGEEEFVWLTQEPDHPVVAISWEDATAFCAWLTKREQSVGQIGPRDEYRLPTDVEWSWAVGIGDWENPDSTPEDKNNIGMFDSNQPIDYPWGKDWPPPKGAGNYAGQEQEGIPADIRPLSPISDYRDDHLITAPVGSYSPNDLGIYDLGGNVSEYCEDLFSPKSEGRVTRGASYRDHRVTFAYNPLKSWARHECNPKRGENHTGFRVILAVDPENQGQ
jgi:formylglycine-generating enzyme required for sulfatase activity